MAKNQVSISTVGQNGDILELAKTVFHEETTETELINQIMRGWYTDRLAGGKGKKLDAVLEEIQSTRNELLAMKIELGQLKSMTMALVQTIGERNHELARRSQEDESGFSVSPSQGETIAR